ncbi:MAG: hypothetical protein ABI183_06880 [Polyangiaceae bacterium]
MNDRRLALILLAVVFGSFALYLAARKSVFFPKANDERVADSAEAADSTLHGADWNGALPIATASGQPPLPTTTPSSSASPFDSAHPPPLSAIPAPIVPLPMDDSVSEKQRARDVEMLSDQVTVLEKQAAAAETKGDTAGAEAIRVREARMKARIASLQDSGAP